ncbi:amidohydrolase [Acanthamoeba castellanii str. Neff]|uniref:Amidohydrolase n=1 Tax=Acanthamoeba castellanii (strain ATCC 30010 / Neff) TaxID=1257118 RepID=L8GIL0_ACACF|nr:amidohydrolase [Acanthamoeba castellanii str. Neff]ELR12832.1 amidohydrolase [Acanthamoeba castellanii str. Neff]
MEGSNARSFVVKNVFVPRALLQEEWQERGNTECVRRDVHFEEGGAIVAVDEPSDLSATTGDSALTVIDGTNKLLLPGFLNGHTHSGEMYNRGSIPPLPLELWLGYLYDYGPQDPNHYYLAALLTAVEGLMTGVTCVLDMPSVLGVPGKEFECLEAICRAYRDVGVRAFVCPLLGDLPFDATVAHGCGHGCSPYAGTDKHDPHKTDFIMAFMEQAVEKLHRPEEGIEIGVGPSGVQTCSDELYTRCRELSEKHGLVRHTHLLETVNQKKVRPLFYGDNEHNDDDDDDDDDDAGCDDGDTDACLDGVQLAYEKYGCSAVDHLKKLGFFNEKTTCAHSIWLDDNDIEQLQTTGATPVHNPLSNLRLGSGIAPVLKYLDARINVCFGCDGAASNDSQDMLEAIKMGSILHNITDFDYNRWITPDQAFRMAAMGGARAVGLQDQTGLVQVGRSADLVLYDLASSLSILPRTDILGLLLLGRPNNLVTDVWVRGRRVFKEGKVAGVDEEKLKRDLFATSEWTTMPRASATRSSVEQRYRQVIVDKQPPSSSNHSTP